MSYAKSHDVGLVCRIDAEQTGRMVAVVGHVSGPVSETGSYSLILSKTDSAGSSSINQSGNLATDVAGKATFNPATLSVDPGGRLDAALTLRFGNQTGMCRLTFPHG